MAAGCLTRPSLKSQGTPFPEVVGILVHGINGIFVIPGLALLLLIVSFFTKVRGAIKWALVVFVLVVVQGQLGFLGHDFPLAGALHGLNALALFGVAIYTGRRLRAAAERLALSSQSAYRRPGVMDRHSRPRPLGSSAGAADRPADRGNPVDCCPVGVAVAGQPGAVGVFGDGYGLPRLRGGRHG